MHVCNMYGCMWILIEVFTVFSLSPPPPPLSLSLSLCNRVLAKLLPGASMSCEAIQSNRKKWVELKKEGRRTPDPEQQLS